jgi:hypothetical protein
MVGWGFKYKGHFAREALKAILFAPPLKRCLIDTEDRGGLSATKVQVKCRMFLSTTVCSVMKVTALIAAATFSLCSFQSD